MSPVRFKNGILLLASFAFCAFFSIQAAWVLLAVSLINYFCGRWIKSAREGKKKVFLILGLIFNVGVLAFFKYADFLIENLNQLTGQNFDLWHILLPVGISFYIFQSLSYLIDVYLEKIKPESNLVVFLLYMMFFSKFLQGPIERAGQLMPQFKKRFALDRYQSIQGLELFCLGLFKKAIIADRLAILVNTVFDDLHLYSGRSLALAVYAFTFQLYFDFAGYTDMARGIGKIFGIDLSPNFDQPFLATTIQDFWRRWHITFSSWLRDYLFTPLMAQFRNYQTLGMIAATLSTFFICGLWHGASWNFVAFGLIHGIYMIGSILTLKKRDKIIIELLSSQQNFKSPDSINEANGRFEVGKEKLNQALGISPMIVRWVRVVVTFHMVAFSFIFFRSGSLSDAFYIVSHLFSFAGGRGAVEVFSSTEILILFIAFGLMLNSSRTLMSPGALVSAKKYPRYVFYAVVINAILFLGVKTYAPFIYFKF